MEEIKERLTDVLNSQKEMLRECIQRLFYPQIHSLDFFFLGGKYYDNNTDNETNGDPSEDSPWWCRN